MLDLRWLVENEATYKNCLKTRNNFPKDSLEFVLSKDSERRKLIQEVEAFRAQKNQIAKEVGQLKRTGGDASALMEKSIQISKNMDGLDAKLNELNQEIENHLLSIPNMLHSDVPEGKGAEENKLIKTIGTPRKFDFDIKDHHDLGVNLGIIDFDRASRMASTRFTTLVGKGAKLERALIQFMLDLHTEKHGYTEMLPPLMANSKALTGTSQLPKFKEDLFKIDGFDLFLIPTAEVTITNYFREEILGEDQLPSLFTGYTPCFRSEAGSYGKDTRGLIRQHQFDKVELVQFCHPDYSWQAHELLTSAAEKVLELLELPYQRMLLCSGDTGFGAAKTYDLEVWLPGQSAYREISSCSNFCDFQARRAGIRFKPKEGGKPRFVHTLNGSGLAVGRTLVAILENYQEKDGSVTIPKALQKYTGFERIESQK
ncbi:MAG: serine--tRNA ligase [Oligoflexia bacterium]|nr:serine--tRNA ligase [Oligoflexia bacterium]